MGRRNRVWHSPLLACVLVLAGLLPVRAADLPPGCLLRIGDTTFRHPGAIDSLLYSPGGEWILSHTDKERDARIWNARTGVLHERFAEPRFTRDIRRLIGITPDGAKVLVENDDGEAVLIRLKNRSEVARWSAKFLTAMSRSGQWAIGADARSRATVWNVETGEPLFTAGKAESREKFQAAFSPNSQEVAITGNDESGVIQIYQLSDKSKTKSITLQNPSHLLLWTANDRLYAAQERIDGLYDTTSGTQLHKYIGSTSTQAVLSPKGDRIYTAGTEGDIRTLTLPNFEATAGVTAKMPVKGPLLALSPDGKQLASTGNLTIRLFDTQTGKPLLEQEALSPVRSLSVSYDGSRILSQHLKGIRLWDAETGLALRTWNSDAGLMAPVLSPDGNVVVIPTPDPEGVTRIWTHPTAADGGTEWRQANKEATFVGFQGNTKSVNPLWLRSNGIDLRLIDPATRQVVLKAKLPEAYKDLSYSPQERLFFGKDSSRFTVLSSGDEPGVVWEERQSHSPILVGSPNGRYVIGCDDTDLYAWIRRESGKRVRIHEFPRNRQDQLHRLRFMPDSRTFAYHREGSNAISFWDVGVWQERFHFEPPGGISDFAFSGDGKRLVIAHPDATITVWDVRKMELLNWKTDERMLPGVAWDLLGKQEAGPGLSAIQALVAKPDDTVKMFTERFPNVKKESIDDYIRDLDDQAYRTREKASRALLTLGEAAEGALRKAYMTTLSAEVRFRAESILREFRSQKGMLPPAILRSFRAVDVLERIGNPGAVALLEIWARGEPASVRTIEARAALARLQLARK